MAFVYPQVTITAVAYNSYVNVADADAYFAASVNFATWSALTADAKGRAIISAVRFLDRMKWQGQKTDPTNALEWPRSGLSYPDGTPVDPATLPTRLVQATCELSVAIVNDPSIIGAPGTGSNIERVKAGSVEVDFFRPTIGTIYDTRLPLIVMDLIGFWLAGFGDDAGVGPTATGTCQDRLFEPHFGSNDTDDYGVR